MAQDQDLPEELKSKLTELLDKLDDSSFDVRERATRKLANLVEELWRTDSPHYRSVVNFLNGKIEGASEEAGTRIKLVIRNESTKVKFIKQDFLGTERGTLVFEYEITIPSEMRIQDIDVYIGGQKENAYYNSASILPVDEPEASSWPEGDDEWEGSREDNQLILKGKKPLTAGTYHFKIIVRDVAKPEGGKARERKVNAVATDRHGAPLLRTKTDIETPYLPSP